MYSHCTDLFVRKLPRSLTAGGISFIAPLLIWFHASCSRQTLAPVPFRQHHLDPARARRRIILSTFSCIFPACPVHACRSNACARRACPASAVSARSPSNPGAADDQSRPARDESGCCRTAPPLPDRSSSPLDEQPSIVRMRRSAEAMGGPRRFLLLYGFAISDFIWLYSSSFISPRAYRLLRISMASFRGC
jgi:hypothetical protein